MPGILLLHLHDGHAVAAAFRRQVEIRDLRKLFLQQGHEHFVQRHAQHGRLVGRLAGIGRVIDRVAAHRDAVDREHGEPVLLVVIAGVVAVRPFQRMLEAGRMAFIWIDMALEHDLGRRRHAQLAADRLRQDGPLAAQQAGELVFGQRVRHGRHRAQDRGRVGAQRHRHRIRLAGVGDAVFAEIERAAAVCEPAHDDLVRPQHLLAVDAQVLALLVRAFRDHETPGNQGRDVARPAMLDRQAGQVDVGAFPDDFLARGALHFLRRHVPHGLDERAEVHDVAVALGRLGLLQARQHVADLAQLADVVRAHAQRHAAGRAEQVGQHRNRIRLAVGADRLFEQQRGPAGAQRAVAHLRHFKIG